MRLLVFAALSSIGAFAQVDTGAVSGVVTDRSGSVIPGAAIKVTQLETNVQTDLRSNDSGFYAAPSLRPGRYEISVTKEGFRAQKSQPFDLRVQDRAEVNFQLEIGATSSEITVSASAPLLESETSSLGQVIEEKTIVELPLNGRNFI
ncbi:MAG: carboxypeptidase-like regulatory domain-containing protein, partial [Acidobacteriota bacterium]|nr:carboxypeptidase-like regulatory domain-containing protein [Acidobacteriota bacterium]